MDKSFTRLQKIKFITLKLILSMKNHIFEYSLTKFKKK